jgi:hypothetical protein
MPSQPQLGAVFFALLKYYEDKEKAGTFYRLPADLPPDELDLINDHAAKHGVSPEVFFEALKTLDFVKDFGDDDLGDILNDRWDPN